MNKWKNEQTEAKREIVGGINIQMVVGEESNNWG